MHRCTVPYIAVVQIILKWVLLRDYDQVIAYITYVALYGKQLKFIWSNPAHWEKSQTGHCRGIKNQVELNRKAMVRLLFDVSLHERLVCIWHWLGMYTLWAPASLLDVHDMPAERITKFVIKKRVSVSSESKSECFFCHEKIVFYLEVNNCLSLFGYLHYHLPVFWLKQIILPNC